MSEEPDQLPDTIDGLITFILRHTKNVTSDPGFREAAHAKIFSILVKDNFAPALQGLSEEIAKSREQMKRSSDATSAQTKIMIKTTKWYTWITGGLLVVSIDLFQKPLRT